MDSLDRSPTLTALLSLSSPKPGCFGMAGGNNEHLVVSHPNSSQPLISGSSTYLALRWLPSSSAKGWCSPQEVSPTLVCQ